jgi:glycosyltransferase involved in cell wall biosynthesis
MTTVPGDRADRPVRISVVIPAFNEARWLPQTLANLGDAVRECFVPVEVIVVDNASDDDTAQVARAAGATVIAEREHNVGLVRNRGAAAATGDVLVFLDADTLVPPAFLRRVAQAMEPATCLGGAASVAYRPASRVVRAYLAGWRVLGRISGMVQGAAQFCRRDAFARLGGYDESQYMGEDVDFFWRLKRLARQAGGDVTMLADLEVVPSARRFDQWPLWRTLVWTNPLVIGLLRRRRWAWRGWYSPGVPR